MSTLRVLLWDQLSADITSLQDANKKQDIIMFCETIEECTYVKHHKKKLVFLLSSMRHFAEQLEQSGYRVHYVKLDDPDNTQTLAGEIKRALTKFSLKAIQVTWPGEYRIYATLNHLITQEKLNLTILEDTRFLASPAEFKQWAKDKKSLRMEFFYREMRKKYHVLMFDSLPEGGKWNFDAENRNFPKTKITIPSTFQIQPDVITLAVIKIVEEHFSQHFGDITHFHYAVTRKDALRALKLFIQERLPHFGDYQDVMMQDQPWLFHSHISFYINNGLLNPMECIKATEVAFRKGDVNLASAEGFIRQILGWREFVRGIYWLNMPTYKSKNFLDAKRRIPDFYWTADTKMNCIKQCVSETKANAYAHHIQRLMVLGNFALLAGIHPDDMNAWYLIVYADAHEWVELPNVTGMILFADGGYLASKPYAGSGAYINKMSNYCDNCAYQVKLKNGPDACPFNYLYWNFLLNHRDKLKNNQRLLMIYSTLMKMSREKIAAIQADSAAFLQTLRSDGNWI